MLNIKNNSFNKKSPLVSIIVPTFNRKFFLEQTLNSIVNQSYKNFEIIIVDNYSTDDTKRFVLSYVSKKIKFYQHHNNGVIAINRNFGIKKANGKYIAFCDDDDIWQKEKLKYQVNFINKHKVSLCYTNAKSFNESGVISEKYVRRTVINQHFKELLWGNFIPNSSVIILKKCFDELGMLNENSYIREDYDMWLRVSEKKLIGGINKSLIFYRIHVANNAASRSKETLKSIQTILNIKNKISISHVRFCLVILFHCLKFILYFIKDSFNKLFRFFYE